MNGFVEQCRQEWKRLRVPDPIADEMAADLAADLREAEAEGVSAEEVLGNGAFDPRSFAASWAAERGVAPVPTPHENLPAAHEKAARRRALVAVALLALLGVIVAALALVSVRHGVAVAWRAGGPHPPLASPPTGIGPLIQQAGGFGSVVVALILLALVIAGASLAAWMWWTWLRSRPPTAAA